MNTLIADTVRGQKQKSSVKVDL